MPTLIVIFLSKYIFILLLWMYIASAVVILVGFKALKIRHRIDVLFRGIIMHGTYIFLSHAMGIMFMMIAYIFIKINSFDMTFLLILIVTCTSIIVADFMVIISSNYLWERLAIGESASRSLVVYGLIITTPWYFIMNFF